MKVLEDELDDELREAVDGAVNALFFSINDPKPEGLNTLMMLLLDWYAFLFMYILSNF